MIDAVDIDPGSGHVTACCEKCNERLQGLYGIVRSNGDLREALRRARGIYDRRLVTSQTDPADPSERAVAVPGEMLEILESRGVRVAELSADRNLWLQSDQTPRCGGHPIIRFGADKKDVVWIGGRCDGKAYVAPAPPWSYYRMPQLAAVLQKGGDEDGGSGGGGKGGGDSSGPSWKGGLREDLQLLAAAGEATQGETEADQALAERFNAMSGREQSAVQCRRRLTRLRSACDAPAPGLDVREVEHAGRVVASKLGICSSAFHVISIPDLVRDRIKRDGPPTAASVVEIDVDVDEIGRQGGHEESVVVVVDGVLVVAMVPSRALSRRLWSSVCEGKSIPLPSHRVRAYYRWSASAPSASRSRNYGVTERFEGLDPDDWVHYANSRVLLDRGVGEVISVANPLAHARAVGRHLRTSTEAVIKATEGKMDHDLVESTLRGRRHLQVARKDRMYEGPPAALRPPRLVAASRPPSSCGVRGKKTAAALVLAAALYEEEIRSYLEDCMHYFSLMPGVGEHFRQAQWAADASRWLDLIGCKQRMELPARPLTKSAIAARGAKALHSDANAGLTAHIVLSEGSRKTQMDVLVAPELGDDRDSAFIAKVTWSMDAGRISFFEARHAHMTRYTDGDDGHEAEDGDEDAPQKTESGDLCGERLYLTAYNKSNSMHISQNGSTYPCDSEGRPLAPAPAQGGEDHPRGKRQRTSAELK